MEVKPNPCKKSSCFALVCIALLSSSFFVFLGAVAFVELLGMPWDHAFAASAALHAVGAVSVLNPFLRITP